ncbi:MAG: UGSC family (seleno)protein, partial [Dehalococcoidia bacterium]|nr:UGSC family (seleno)protein [Dehalococcoidia bacterium]
MLRSRRVAFPDNTTGVYRAYEEAYELGWTDGLPIIPPTAELVQAFVDCLGRDPTEVVAEIPPRYGVATVEKIAINAVMAGCRPEYWPILLAAIEAMVEPRFNLNGIQATTASAAPLLIVNGPIRDQVGIGYGSNALGQGNRANATIGRALRLILLNVGGGIPGSVDEATLGQPGKYTFCLGENEEDSPWEPLHVERGFRREQSTATVVGVNGTQSIVVTGQDAERVLTVIANSINIMGCPANCGFPVDSLEPMLIMCSTHAKVLAAAGLSKRDVQQILWERARIPIELFPSSLAEAIIPQGRVVDGKVGSARRPEDIIIVVAGGSSGLHTTY